MTEMEFTRNVCMITGANSGIGKQAALQLAQLGMTVVMVCRNKSRGQTALSEIRKNSGNDRVDLLLADLSSQKSIRQLVKTFSSSYDHLHSLINNAANFDYTLKKPVSTEDGIEVIFATNHLGPFLLTNLLLDILKGSAPSRIVNIASKGLITHPWLAIEFDNLNGQKKFNYSHAYYHSKLAQIMFTYELARRLEGTGVSVNCIRVPNVKVDLDRTGDLPWHMRYAYRMKRSFGITPEEMAKTYVHLVTAPEMEGVSGRYFDERAGEVKSSEKSYDREVWKNLWDVSAQLTSLRQ
ncbi:MAG: SDR family NAD(P)-dependent oxidoreductase [Theionarchaea archaeon]|nr:SDR family NAD(P)-dependent oxidoreductase [Theionarchaea archaeon]MBU7037821.1 SDR family NAD(P)-dependent oxidoreductase [Theionarchaea archaeon]